ncbi:MAG: hypothetical protein L6R39_000575 [Caloplaca ligustica]|nr:MAG: hypothetical protein L6R39_000575 [Caloplaca ligustica]
MRLDALVANTSTAALEIRKQAFWIDTLCIPVDPKFKEFRKLAITRLDGAFRDARRVLVLDADLHRFSGPCSRTELAIRIVCCGWMRRLWTLAEAVVADETANATKVDIQFLGGSTDFNGIAGRDINHIYHTEAAMLSIFTAFPQFLSRERAFGSVWQALKYRSTSKMEDEAICLASIFGFGSKDIASIAGAKTAEERMHLMYTLLDQIPASILFNTTKKLTNGFGWAPASLIGSLGMRPSHSKAGRCDAQGLHVQFSGYVGIRDSPSPSILDHPFTLEWYIGDPGEAAPTLAIRAYRGLAMARDLPPDKSVELDAIELRKLLKEIPTLAIILDPDEENHSAALVSVSREEGGIIYATFKANLSISRRKKGKDRHGGWRDLLINVRQVPPEQEWCIQ